MKTKDIDQELQKHVPPHDRNAEVSLLGALMLDNQYIPAVCSILCKEDFYDRRHQTIFEAMIKISEQNLPVDLVTVADKLTSTGNLDKVGSRTYLVELGEDIYSAANCERHAQIIKEKAILRRLMSITSTIFGRAQRMEGEVKDLLDYAESKIFEVGTERTNKGFTSINSLMATTFETIEGYSRLKDGITGMATGFTALDAQTSGLHKGELIVVAGRPGMGKTAFVLRIVENIAVERKKACAVFSLEMANEQIVQRLLCSRARANFHRLRTGRLRDQEYTNLNIAGGALAEAPIFVDDSADLNIWTLRTKARQLKARHDLGLIVIDYLQLMSLPERSENRQQEISTISRSLKALSKELQVPVIACSQLSRMVEQRGGEKRPILADLRESGAIEQDADVVMFVYRPAAYKISDDERAQLRGTDEENLAEIIIAKQRNGPIGTIKLTFLGEYMRFENREIHRGQQEIDTPF